MRTNETNEMSGTGHSQAGKVIIGDLAAAKYSVLTSWLKKEGVTVDFQNEVEGLVEKVKQEPYDLCLVNWLLGGLGPFEIIRKIRETAQNPRIKVVVISRQVQKVNIQNAVKAGAHDFVAEPFENEVLLKRILYHLAPQKAVDAGEYEFNPLSPPLEIEPINLMVEICERLSYAERGTEPTVLFEVTNRISQITQSNRTSLVIAELGQDTGLVIASSDDPSFHNFPLVLSKYPEIQHVLFSGKFVLIPDVAKNDLTVQLKKQVKSIPIGSLMVFPVRYQNEVIGVLTIRRPRASELPSLAQLRLLQAIANTMAAQSNVQLLLRRIYRDQIQLKAG